MLFNINNSVLIFTYIVVYFYLELHARDCDEKKLKKLCYRMYNTYHLYTPVHELLSAAAS